MGLNFGANLFPPRREFSINYDWIDIGSATGYIVYDGCNALDSTGNNYFLIESSKANSIVGSSIYKSPLYSAVGGNSGISFNEDFDLSQFQLPQTIKGNTYVRVSIVTRGSMVDTPIITARLRKWDGTTETTIISTTSTTLTTTSNENLTTTLKLVTPKTLFKKGEILRLTVEISTGNNESYAVAHNPKDTAISTFDVNNSRLTIAIPFKIDR